MTVTVDGFVQDGTAWNGGDAAIARAAEYGPLYDSGWLNFSSMKVGGTYGADGMVKCLEQGENHIKYVLDVSAFSRYDLIWNCTFDMKGKLENMSAVNINLEVTFGNTVEETSSTLTRIGTIGVGSYPTQGGAVYGDRLFQFHDKMGEIRVYDLKKKEMIAVCPMTPVSTYHCNNASFGAERYAENDEFPLLYVSMENIAEHNVIVLRVQRAGADFTFTKVQTITFPSVSEGGYYYPNATVDAETGKLYYLGWPKESWKKEEYGADATLKLITYNLPKLADGDVTLGIGNTVDVPLKTATQGFLAEKGMLYQVYGLNGGNNYLSKIDCASGTELFSKTLSALGGIGSEPESISRYGDDFIVVLQGGEIWLVDHNVFAR